jgi:hypothetical protein
LRVRIVRYEGAGWIVDKFARRLSEQLAAHSVEADIAREPDPSADINYHLVYVDFSSPATRSDTVMVTHVDDLESLRLLRRQLEEGASGICMSRDTYHRLLDSGLPAERLCFIPPAHDGNIHPRPLLIGIFTRLYSDGRKRERLLVELARRVSPADFRFFIMGAGWDRIVREVRGMGFAVEFHPDFDAAIYEQIIPALDYYLYLGTDEGSMGFIDAVAAAVPTIATPQGFHIEVAGTLTHPFWTLDELVAIFQEIASRRNSRSQSVAEWTWPAYARRHVQIWRTILQGESLANLTWESDYTSDYDRVTGRRPSFTLDLTRTSLVRAGRRAGNLLRRLGNAVKRRMKLPFRG